MQHKQTDSEKLDNANFFMRWAIRWLLMSMVYTGTAIWLMFQGASGKAAICIVVAWYLVYQGVVEKRAAERCLEGEASA